VHTAHGVLPITWCLTNSHPDHTCGTMVTNTKLTNNARSHWVCRRPSSRTSLVETRCTKKVAP